MLVLLTFRDGRQRPFPEATGACKRGGLMVVMQEGAEDRTFDAAEVISAMLTLDTGELIVEPSGARSN